MEKKIETMVLGIGELSLEAICTWFPSKDKDEVAKVIENSNVIGLKGSKVMPLAKMEELEEKELREKRINLVPNNAEITTEVIVKEGKVANEGYTKKGETAKEVMARGDLGYSELLELISKYNARIKMKYNMLVDRNFGNMKEAIIDYYGAKFKVVENSLKLSNNSYMFSLLQKKTSVEMAYLYIGELLSKEDFNRISDKYPEETIYFCVTKDAEILPNVSDKEYYLKDVEEIVNKYLDQYTLTEATTKVYKIG